MSLEKVIEENTKAVKALTEALTAQSGKPETQSEKPKTKTKKKKAEKTEDKKAASKIEEAVETDSVSVPDSEITLAGAKTATLDIVERYVNGREIVRAVLGDFGPEIKKVSDLHEDQCAEYWTILHDRIAQEGELLGKAA